MKNKKRYLISLISIFFALTSIMGQSIIQSTCLNDTLIFNQEIEDFSYGIALSEMNYIYHHYHDSILVPKPFLDSIKRYVSAYHNALYLSDSIKEYSDFGDDGQAYGSISLIFDTASNCFHKQDNKLVITNDTLSRYIDSSKLGAQTYNEHEIILRDTNTHIRINLRADFDFFYNISCITEVNVAIIMADPSFCYKSRSGVFNDTSLDIYLLDVNYCDNNSYANHWNYRVTENCQVEIIDITDISTTKNNVLSKIYPNPFSNLLHIESNQQIDMIRLSKINGVVSNLITDPKNGSINTSDLGPGIYLVEILYKNGLVEYKKVIKIE